MVDAFHELFAGHFVHRAEMTVPDRADDRVDLAGLLVHRTNAVHIFDIAPVSESDLRCDTLIQTLTDPTPLDASADAVLHASIGEVLTSIDDGME